MVAEVGSQVAVCRKLGLLGPTLPGRAGGARLHLGADDAIFVSESATVTKVDVSGSARTDEAPQ